MKSSILGWAVLGAPISIVLFFLIFSSRIPFIVEQSAKEAEDSAEKVWRFGQQYMRSGDYQNAYGSYMKALEISPDLAEAYISLSQILYQFGQIDKAIETLNKALSLNPPQKDLVMNNLGLLYAQKGETGTALGIFKQVLELGIRKEQAYNNVGNTYMNAGNYGYAAAAYRHSLENKASIESSYREMLYITMAEFQGEEEVADAWEAAKEQFEQGAGAEVLAAYDRETVDKYGRTDEREVELLGKYAMALERSGNAVEAEKIYLRALKIDPRAAELCFRLGDLYWRGGRLEEARTYYARTLQIDRNHQKAGEALRRVESGMNSE